jgi:hypothetical protein
MTGRERFNFGTAFDLAGKEVGARGHGLGSRGMANHKGKSNIRNDK